MKKNRYTDEQIAYALKQAEMRYGYFRIYILLRHEGWIVNHKRV